MCFSSSLRLLWSKAVIVSSASTSYPICFCMKRNCLAMYSYEGKKEMVIMTEGLWWLTSVKFYTTVHLVLPVVLLGMAQHSVAKPADVSERSVALIAQLLQPQHWAITAVREWGLKKFEYLQRKLRILVLNFYPSNLDSSVICLTCTCFKIFCSLMSFCLSLLGLFTMISKTSCPLFGMSTTKNTRSSRSLVTNLGST